MPIKKMLRVVILAALAGRSLPLALGQSTSGQTGLVSQAADADVKPMASNANPSFEVATIRPSNPNHPLDGGMSGRRTAFPNTTVLFLVSFVYDLHDNQIIGAPDWMATEKFDFVGVSDTPGKPNLQQVKIMIQKLLADRLQLKFHREKRDMPAYVLTVAKDGPKFSESQNDPNDMPSLLMQPGFPKIAAMKGRNLTMADFARLMQSGILDRPVVDQTNLQGRYDFLLTWTPDDSQFRQTGMRLPPGDTANAPSLFTATKEQLGLKLSAEKKTPVEVMVLDHIEKPSEN